MNKIVFILAIIGGASFTFFLLRSNIMSLPENKKQTNIPKQAVRSESLQNAPLLSTIATGLQVPWAIAFLPDGNMLYTERPGRLHMIEMNNNFNNVLIADIEEVKEIGEGGLMGIAVSPGYETNKHIFLYYTYTSAGNNVLNRLVRYKLDNNNLAEKTILIDNIPGSSNHNGGRIKFGPDGYLYITTGDAQDPSLAQSKDSPAGKILRVDENGKPAPDNPFGNAVFSYGHRNPQGLAWEGSNLYETEHGPVAQDEINTIVKGENYGWPVVKGDGKKTGMHSPLYHSGVSTWAPSGTLFYEGSLYFAGLRGNALYKLTFQDGAITIKEYFKNELGRIREALLGPDGFIYLTTSNKDGRGNPQADDDKILRMNPSRLD